MCLFSLFHSSPSTTLLICPQCRFHHQILSYDSIPKNYLVIEFIYYFKRYPLKASPPSAAHLNQIHVLSDDNGKGIEEDGIEEQHSGEEEERRGEEEEKGQQEISMPCADGEIHSGDEISLQRRPLTDLSIEEVSCLLTNLKLSKFVEIFLENDIDGLTLSQCQTEDDLTEAGIYMKVKARFLFEKIQIYQSIGVLLADLQPPRLADELSSDEDDISIWITGMTGIYEFMNGMYYPTEEVFMGRRRYFKLQHDCWIEYNSDCHQWHIKPKDKKATTNAWAYLPSSPDTRYPYDTSPSPYSCSSWYLFDGHVFNKNDNVYCFPHYSIHFAGIPIDNSIPSLPSTLNGYYEPVPQDICGGICRYRQRSFGYSSSTRYWIEYSISTKQWQLKRDIDLGTNNYLLYILCSNPKDLWSNIFQWVVSPTLLDSASLSTNSSPLISPDILSFPKLYSLEITGGTGPTATHIRGVYQPTHEIFSGWVRYQKVTDTNCWLEKMDCQKQWHVKPSKDKCLTNAWACTKYASNGPPYLAQSGWLVYDGNLFHLDSAVKCTRKLPLI